MISNSAPTHRIVVRNCIGWEDGLYTIEVASTPIVGRGFSNRPAVLTTVVFHPLTAPNPFVLYQWIFMPRPTGAYDERVVPNPSLNITPTLPMNILETNLQSATKEALRQIRLALYPVWIGPALFIGSAVAGYALVVGIANLLF
jgi:hypothetical protein